MRSPSLDFFYAQTDKFVKLTESYSEVKGLAFILRACRCKPYEYVFEQKSGKLILYRWWFDEYGNSLKIVKTKKVNIIENDLNLKRERLVCTDIYYNLAMEKVAKISKMMYVCYGKDEDLYEDCVLVSFLGLDGYLRTYLYLYGEWQQVSPLLMGLEHLQLLASNLDIRYYTKIGKKENCPIPCNKAEAWLSSLPASPAFTSLMKKECEVIVPFLGI